MIELDVIRGVCCQSLGHLALVRAQIGLVAEHEDLTVAGRTLLHQVDPARQLSEALPIRQIEHEEAAVGRLQNLGPQRVWLCYRLVAP